MNVSKPNESVLVTGGSGFIGTHLVQELLRRNHRVMNIDIRPPLSTEYRSLWKPIDIMDAAALKKVFKEFQPEFIIHLAARTDLDETRWLDGYATNIQGVQNVIDALASTPSARRAIFTSSQAVCRIGLCAR